MSSIGLTALLVAAGRAIDTHRDDSLVDDPFAEAFVAAAGTSVSVPVRQAALADESGAEGWRLISNYVGIRSRFFDEFCTSVVDEVDQIVILAAGLDTRAVRLGFPAGTTVFEVDQPKVLAFKEEVLGEQGATAQCARRTVAADLREDWPAALREAGFDSTRPAAWLAEGLLPYLSPIAEITLLNHIDRLSVPGSEVAVENIRNIAGVTKHPVIEDIANQVGIHLPDLVHADDRPDLAAWFDVRGWISDETAATDVAMSYGREVDSFTYEAGSSFITAQR